MISITQITIIMLKSKNYTFYWQSIPCHQTHFISVCMYFLNKYLFSLTFDIGFHKEIISSLVTNSKLEILRTFGTSWNRYGYLSHGHAHKSFLATDLGKTMFGHG